MNKNIQLKGRLKQYFTSPLRLGLIFIPANILIYVLHWQAGLILTGFLILYAILAVLLYRRSKGTIINEMISFATDYGQVQRELLQDLEIPYALLDGTGHFVWMNRSFEELTQLDRSYHRIVTLVFPEITRELIPMEENGKASFEIDYKERHFQAVLKRIRMQSLSGDSRIIETDEQLNSMISLHLFDDTAVQKVTKEIRDESLVVGMVYIDNYDEVMDSIEDVRRSLLAALIERKINRYISSKDGICSKTEKDKFTVILRRKALEQMEEEHFDLLSEVKTVNIGNEMAITVSIGIGSEGTTFAQNLEFAKNAIDLALGRGGDQAVVKNGENVTYYGGKSQSVEKSTRVKARVKAQALKEIISTRDAVYIMGHRIGDIDSFGACIGIYRIAKYLHKEAHIVLNETTSSLQPIVDLFRNNPEYGDDLLLTSAKALDMPLENSVLVVVDVNKPSITECPELLRRCPSIVVFDHHRQGTEQIENATLSYVEGYASSTCEMVSEILQYIGDNVRIRQEEADAIYAGIVVDTNNFMSKTGVRTFEAAAFLRRTGADMTRVRKLFREDAVEYKTRADAVSQAEIYKEAFAISVCSPEGLSSPTVVCAQAANELLDIRGVRGSFVLTSFQDQIFISARSIDEVNVQVIMERMGGGGHMNIAGCQLKDVTMDEAIALLKQTINTLMEEGELS